MQQANSTEIKNRFGEYLEIARKEPVQIQRIGRPVAVIISWEEYERLESVEDAYWGLRAEAAKAAGMLTPEETAAFIESKMKDAE